METTIKIKDFFKTIIDEQNNIRDLFDSWKITQHQKEKSIIVDKFVREICIHASCEERYLYPLIEEKNNWIW